MSPWYNPYIYIMIIWPTQDTTNRTTDVDQKIAFWLWELFSEASLEEFGMKNEFIHEVFTMAFVFSVVSSKMDRSKVATL